jgi:hypothetical protein
MNLAYPDVSDKLLVVDHATLTVDGARTFKGGRVINGGCITSLPTSSSVEQRLLLTFTNQLVVDFQSSISVDGKGYLPGYTQGNTTVGAATGYNGASHGGFGVSASWGSRNNVYGSFESPTDLGAGAGGYFYNGSGGGAIKLTAGEITNHGRISADGSLEGGAGGSILIKAWKYRGDGVVQANAKNSNSGGGRVAVDVSDTFDAEYASLRAYGGNGAQSSIGGGCGSVYIHNKFGDSRVVRFDNAGVVCQEITPWWMGDRDTILDDPVTYACIVNVVGKARVGMLRDSPTALSLKASALKDGYLEVGPSITGHNIVLNQFLLRSDSVSADDFKLTNNSQVTSWETSNDQERSLTMNVANVIDIDGTSSIDVSAMGYRPGHTLGNVADPKFTYQSAGSHGGVGGILPMSYSSSDYEPINAYGSFEQPVTLGSGGSNYGCGGGVVRITCSSVVNNGAIRANGEMGSSCNAAGGSIWITASEYTGGGDVSADGSSGSTQTTGGGGRICIELPSVDSLDVDRIHAFGGDTSVPSNILVRRGGQGSVLLRAVSKQESIIVWNNAGRTPYVLTPWWFGDRATVDGDPAEYRCRFFMIGNAGLRVESSATHIVMTDATTYIDSGILSSAASLIAEHDWIMQTTLVDAPSLSAGRMVLGNGSIAVTDLLTSGALRVSDQGLLKSYATTTQAEHRLEINVAQDLLVDPQGVIDVSGLGYTPGMTEGNIPVAVSSFSSASHGGSGVNYKYSTYWGYIVYMQTNQTYGSMFAPTSLGTGCRTSGGGAVRINCGSLINAGVIRADAGGEGSAGGSLFITAKTIGGGGMYSACGKDISSGFPGGGGRIAFVLDTETGLDLNHVSARGGVSGDGSIAGCGSIYVASLEHVGLPMVRFDNSGNVPSDTTDPDEWGKKSPKTAWWFGVRQDLADDPQSAYAVRLQVVNGAQVALEGAPNGLAIDGASSLFVNAGFQTPSKVTATGSVSFDAAWLVSPFVQAADEIALLHAAKLETDHVQAHTVHVLENSLLTSFKTTATVEHHLLIEADGTVTVDANALVDVSGRGYLARTTLGFVPMHPMLSAASHGGLGMLPGYPSYTYPNEAYGSFIWPVTLGAGGTSDPYGGGGGAIRIAAAAIVNNGLIAANGRPTSAGGSILLTANNVSGSGDITANSENGGFGGGGGRIAIYAADVSGLDIAKCTAFGGTYDGVYVHGAGGCGTVYIRQTGDVFGRLILNNNGNPVVAEPLPIFYDGPETKCPEDFRIVNPDNIPWVAQSTAVFDFDSDDLPCWEEAELGTQPRDFDTNDDGVGDGQAHRNGIDPVNMDIDGDGLSNAMEIRMHLNPYDADTDRDGVLDGVDAFPLDPTRWAWPPGDPGDNRAPVIVLTHPEQAVPLP